MTDLHTDLCLSGYKCARFRGKLFVKLKAFNFVSGQKCSYCLTIYMPHGSLIYHINLYLRYHGQIKKGRVSV